MTKALQRALSSAKPIGFKTCLPHILNLCGKIAVIDMYYLQIQASGFEIILISPHLNIYE